MQETDDLTDFEGRAAGTDAERRAARHLEARLHALGREAETDPISIHPNFAQAHAIHALLGIVGSVLSVTVPIAGAAMVLFAATSAYGDLSGSFYLVRRLTGRRASQNVTSLEDGGKPGVMVLLAHYDLPRGNGGMKSWPFFRIFFGSLMAITVCTVLRLSGLEGLPLTIIQFVPTVVLIAAVPLLIDIPLSPVSGRGTPGVSTVLRLAERYGGQLDHFDVWVVFPGAHEGLMLGMRAWLKPRKKELDPASTVFIDVGGARQGHWVPKEGLVVGMRYHPDLARLCEGRGVVSQGASDALMARAAGFPAIAVSASYESCAALVERIDEEIGPELS